MNNSFSETLRMPREERGFSQNALGQQLLVTRSTIARWESGLRLPDTAVTGFIWPLEAIEYAKENKVALAILDIELF